MESYKEKPPWMREESLKNIPVEKLDFLQKMVFESTHLSQKELMPFLMALAQKSRSSDISFTREEMDALRDEGTLDWVLIDGAVFFKDNAFENAIKSRPALHSRLKDPSLLDDSNENARMLNEIIASMKRDGHAHYRYHLRTTLSIAEHAQRPGQRIRVHLPLPLRDGQCTPGSIIVTEPAAKHIAAETEPQRTAYF